MIPRKQKRLVGYALNHKSELATYLTHPEADIDNNRAERAIRPFTIARKNFLFCDTERGAEASARVFTIVECAKLNDLDVFEYLKFLLKTLFVFFLMLSCFCYSLNASINFCGMPLGPLTAKISYSFFKTSNVNLSAG